MFYKKTLYVMLVIVLQLKKFHNKINDFLLSCHLENIITAIEIKAKFSAIDWDSKKIPCLWMSEDFFYNFY